MIKAEVFEKAADYIKEYRGFSCDAIGQILGTYDPNKYINLWKALHSDTDDEFVFIVEIKAAAAYASLDGGLFREQLLRELALSLRMQGLSE